MATSVTVGAQNKIWKAQEDARILADAEEILKDKVRLSNAKK